MQSHTVVRRRVWLVALATLLVGGSWAISQSEAIAGGSPPGEGVEVLYVTVGTNFPDALGIGPGAAINGAPIVLVPTNPPIPAVIETELIRLDPRGVVLVGGTAAISDAMRDEIEALLPNAVVARLDGANRYETNAKILQAIFPVEEWISIPPSAFVPDHPDTDDASIGATIAFNVTDGTLRAPVALPHSATVLELRAEITDSSGADLTVTLTRISEPGTGGPMASVSSSGSPGIDTLTTSSITQPLIDNSDYAYQINVSGATGVDLNIGAVQIRFQRGAP